jgi:hypothetical protein
MLLFSEDGWTPENANVPASPQALLQATTTRRSYEIPGIILLQAHLYTYSLLRGVTLEVFHFSSYALSPTMLPLLETLELLLWNSFHCCRHIFFLGCLHYPDIFGPLRQNLYLGTTRNHSEPNKGERVGVLFQ